MTTPISAAARTTTTASHAAHGGIFRGLAEITSAGWGAAHGN
jgi:hypothetical protein